MSPEQVRGEKAGDAVRHLLLRRDPLRDAHGRRALPRRHPHLEDHDAAHREAAGPARASPDIPKYLEAVVQKCMEVDLALRYKNAARDPGRPRPRARWTARSPCACSARSRGARARSRPWPLARAGRWPGSSTGPWRRGPGRSAVARPPEVVRTLAIVPFTNATGSAEMEWLRSGLAGHAGHRPLAVAVRAAGAGRAGLPRARGVGPRQADALRREGARGGLAPGPRRVGALRPVRGVGGEAAPRPDPAQGGLRAWPSPSRWKGRPRRSSRSSTRWRRPSRSSSTSPRPSCKADADRPISEVADGLARRAARLPGGRRPAPERREPGRGAPAREGDRRRPQVRDGPGQAGRGPHEPRRDARRPWPRPSGPRPSRRRRRCPWPSATRSTPSPPWSRKTTRPRPRATASWPSSTPRTPTSR